MVASTGMDTLMSGLIGDVGLGEKLAWVPTKVGFFAQGRIWNFGTPMDLLRFGPISLIERVRLGPFPFPFSAFKNAGSPKKKGNHCKFSAKEILDYLESLTDPDQMADLVSCALLPGAVERQTILETVHLEERLKHLIHFLIEEVQRARKGAQS